MPRRDRDDDYDDDVPEPLGPLDKMYRDTNIVVLIIFGFCCGLIAFVLSLVALLTAKDPKAKSNATVVVIISAITGLLGIISTVIQLAAMPR